MAHPAKKKIAHCHKLIAEVAKGIMHETYSMVMADNQIWQLWQDQYPEMSRKQLELEYVRTRWGLAIPAARATLAHMLTLTLDEARKEEIMEALALDNGLLLGRKAGGQEVMKSRSIH